MNCYFFTDMHRGLQLNLTILVPRCYANGTIRNMGIAGLGYDLATAAKAARKLRAVFALFDRNY
jgi:hypothetical protein